jgi:multiple sugar transport system substrate-binding protein
MKGVGRFVKARGLSRADCALLALGALALLAGLLRPGAGGAASGAAAPVVTFTQWWQDELDAGALEGVAAEFEGLHPEIKIALRRVSYEDARALLFAPAGENGEAGDVLAIDPLWSGALEARGVLEPAGAGGAAEIPVLGYFCPFFYNVEILKAAGFSAPPKTREEFYHYAKKAADPGAGVYGMVMALGPGSYRGFSQDLYSWIWAAGGKVTEGGKPAPSGRETAGALEFLASLDREGLLHPGSLGFGEEEKREAFIGGRSAFMIAAVQDTEILRRRMGGDAFGFTAIPAAGSGAEKPVFGAFGWSVGVSRGSVHKEEAKIFAAFLAERGAPLSEALHGVPGNRSNPLAGDDPFYLKAWDLYIAGDFIREAPWTEGADPADAFREELARLFAPAGNDF